MIDFGVLPPEINSGRMYTGPGAGPMLAAATAWDVLADESSLTAASFESTVADLTGGPWRGPASLSMAAAAMPFAAWLSGTAAQAEQAAGQAKAAAAAYETAFAMTVPPQLVAANRAQLMLLIATNFFGQNTPAIAATEVHYAEMWAQDAAAMYVYSGSSETATKMSPFTPPPHTTNPAGLAGQAAAVSHSAGTTPGVPTTLPPAPTHPTVPAATAPHLVAQPAASTAAQTVTGAPAAITPGTQASYDYWSLFNQYTQSETSPVQFTNVGMRFLFSGHEFPQAFNGVKGFMADAAKAAEGAAKSVGTASAIMPGVSGGMPTVGLGQAAQVGALSVPSSWPGVAPAANPATATLVASRAAAVAAGETEMASRGAFGMPGVPGAAAAAAGGGHGLRFVPRYGYRHKIMTRPPNAG